MREAWTDERLDDLNAKVDRGFDRLETELRSQRGELSDLRREMNARFDALNRTLIGSAVTLVAAVIASKAIPF